MVAAHWLGVYRSNPVKPGVRVWEFVTILAAQSASMSALGKRVRNLAPEQLLQVVVMAHRAATQPCSELAMQSQNSCCCE
jgi:hypothetical protein